MRDRRRKAQRNFKRRYLDRGGFGLSYFVASEGALEAGAAVVARKRSISRFAALTLAALSRRLLGTSSMVALGLVLATSTPSRATDWTGGTSTDWFTATNWSAGVPTSAGTAKIDTVAPNATVSERPARKRTLSLLAIQTPAR